MVFPNSISIFTKEDKEIFFTSFMYRDQAFELIYKIHEEMHGIKKETGFENQDSGSQEQINNIINSPSE